LWSRTIDWGMLRELFLHNVSHNYCAVRSVLTKYVVVVLYHTAGVRQLLSYRHRVVVFIEMYSMLIQGDTEGIWPNFVGI
jgi:hypothetical protein